MGQIPSMTCFCMVAGKSEFYIFKRLLKGGGGVEVRDPVGFPNLKYSLSGSLQKKFSTPDLDVWVEGSL